VKRPRAVAVVGAFTALVACTSSSGSSPGPSGSAAPVTITLLTHDSFDVTRSVLQRFEDSTGITVKVVTVGDAGQLANRLILGAGNPEGDVAFGVDDSQIADLFAHDVFSPYTASGMDQVPDRYASIDPEHRVTPIDHGEVCVNLDLSAYLPPGSEAVGLPAPASFEDLADPRYRGQLVVENPATSSPGLDFLLATVAAYGDPGYLDYWERLRDNGVTVVDGWERAYVGEFSGAAGGDGTHPLVVSYATSPVAEVYYADPPVTQAPTGVLTDTCYSQVEFAGVLAGSPHEQAAQRLIDFMLSTPFQNDIPLRMFVAPVSSAARPPALFRRFAVPVPDPYSLPPDQVAANRADWVAAWADLMGQ
jgi:thiamine transport system substrate-binding protein